MRPEKRQGPGEGKLDKIDILIWARKNGGSGISKTNVYSELVIEAIKMLNDKDGSTTQTICKWIQNKYPDTKSDLIKSAIKQNLEISLIKTHIFHKKSYQIA